MTLRGVISDGRLVLDDGGKLPDGTHVSVTVSPARAGKSRAKATDPLARLGRRAVSTGIPDLADEHDHYAYGTPKRVAKRTAATRKRGGGK